MARIVCVFLAALLGICSASDIFDQVLGDVTSCLDVCELTYTLHTYPVADDYYACRRGCRLFSIVQFVEGDESVDLNVTLTACTNACSEAYSTADDSKFACIVGCKGEIPSAKQRQKELMEEEELVQPNIHLLEPLILARNFYCSLWDQMHSYISYYSWSAVYLEADNGRIYIFQSGPEIYTQSLRGGKTLVRNMETNLEPLRQINDATLYPDDVAWSVVESEEANYSDWLSCVSVKSGLPKWLLSATLLLSSMALLWLCCASSATAPDHRVKSEKLSIYGDLDYLREGGYKSSTAYLKTVSNVVETGDDQAKPLPVKAAI